MEGWSIVEVEPVQVCVCGGVEHMEVEPVQVCVCGGVEHSGGGA